MLTLKFPLFNSTDDLEALMEIAAIFGRASMEKCAMLHSEPLSPFSSLTQGRGYATNTPDRTIITNCPIPPQPPLPACGSGMAGAVFPICSLGS